MLFESIIDWCKSNSIDVKSNEDLINDETVIKHYQKITNEFNARLGQDEKVKRFRLVSDEWTPETGELSPTLKLKRKIIKEKYNSLIQDIFVYKNETINAE